MSGMDQLETDGFCLLPGAVPSHVVATAIARWESIATQSHNNPALLTSDDGSAYGARNILDLWL